MILDSLPLLQARCDTSAVESVAKWQFLQTERRRRAWHHTWHSICRQKSHAAQWDLVRAADSVIPQVRMEGGLEKVRRQASSAGKLCENQCITKVRIEKSEMSLTVMEGSHSSGKSLPLRRCSILWSFCWQSQLSPGHRSWSHLPCTTRRQFLGHCKIMLKYDYMCSLNFNLGFTRISWRLLRLSWCKRSWPLPIGWPLLCPGRTSAWRGFAEGFRSNAPCGSNDWFRPHRCAAGCVQVLNVRFTLYIYL